MVFMSEPNFFDIAKAYKLAIPLNKAVFEFTNSKLLENYQGVAIKQPKFKASSFLGIMNEGLQAFQAVGLHQSNFGGYKIWYCYTNSKW